MLQDNHPGEMVLPGHMDQCLKDRGDEEGQWSVGQIIISLQFPFLLCNSLMLGLSPQLGPWGRQRQQVPAWGSRVRDNKASRTEVENKVVLPLSPQSVSVCVGVGAGSCDGYSGKRD